MNNSQIIKTTKQNLHELMADMWSEIRNNELTGNASRADTSLIVKTCELHHQLQSNLKLLQQNYEQDESQQQNTPAKPILPPQISTIRGRVV